MKGYICICGGKLFSTTGSTMIICEKCTKMIQVGDWENCEHNYATKTCPFCGQEFCYDCCDGTNIDQGGKHEPDYMICPACKYDYYQR